MANRKERIYSIIKKETEKLLSNIDDQSMTRIGFDTDYISLQAGINRTNTSKELNELFKEDNIIKIKGKPVLYLDKKTLENKRSLKINNILFDNYDAFRDILLDKPVPDKCDSDINSMALDANPNHEKKSCRKKSAIDFIIGADSSLKYQVEQAKAAILYPPNGLHTLIIGSTGVGKTTFAEAMYRYGVDMGRYPKDDKYIVFNCADYAENPQLLMSHLFGYVKGAFTGANEEREGLIDHANGGILFLDELHRLPYEGQEMLFLLIDRGCFRRLGETSNMRKANVMIISATTENPDSAILRTLLRRIPIVIKLPDLRDRTIKERVKLTCSLFKSESKRLKLPIKVNKEVFKGFLYYECDGNIGQLRSDIQFVCARAFLDCMEYGRNIVEIKLSHLSKQVKEGLFKINENKHMCIPDAGAYENKDLVFSPDSPDINDEAIDIYYNNNSDSAESIYSFLSDTWRELSKEGLTGKTMRDRIYEQIDDYFKSFVLKSNALHSGEGGYDYNIVKTEIIKFVEEGLNEIKDIIDLTQDKTAIYYIALHVSRLVEYNKLLADYKSEIDIAAVKEYKEEHRAAEIFMNYIIKKMDIEIPKDEIIFITMLFYVLKNRERNKSIAIIVTCYGLNTATAIAGSVNGLLNVECVYGIDIPFNEKVADTYELIVQKILSLKNIESVIIFADLRGLSIFADLIEEKVRMPIKYFEVFTTSMVVDAARLSLLNDITVDQISETISNNRAEQFGLVNYLYQFDDNKENELYKNKREIFIELLINILDTTLTFLNPKKSCAVLIEVLTGIANELNVELDEDIIIKFLFHCSCMIERVIMNKTFYYKEVEQFKIDRNEMFGILDKNFVTVEEIFGIKIGDEEKAYIVEMIDTHYDTVIDTHN